MLLWFQRKWVSDKYQDSFTPTAGQDDDNVPYDFDHLVPQSNWSSLHGIYYDAIKENRKLFSEHHYNRRMLGNSIVNYRVMDGPDNRSRGDCPLEKGFLEEKDQWENYAFDPNDNEIQMWGKASPHEGCKIWDDERLLAFQGAVESRVLYLYKRYFDEVKFVEWTKLNCLSTNGNSP